MGKRFLFNCISHPHGVNTLWNSVVSGRFEENPGDMVYAYAVMNALCRNADDEFIPTGYYRFRGFSIRKIEEFNETCEAFVLPLANIFSPDWCWLLKLYTPLIQKLKIPCVVPCVGVTNDAGGFSFGEDVDRTIVSFVHAVLEKSPRLGVRGEATARYLEHLGFQRDCHFSVLGCPSAYTYGSRLPRLEAPRNFGKCAFSLNQRAGESQCSYVECLARLFREKVFISQYHPVFFHYMLKCDCTIKERLARYPMVFERISRYAKDNEIRFFLNRGPWMRSLSQMDFYVGHRIHGALLAILAGVPAAVVPFEARTRELADFHGIPMLENLDERMPECLENSVRALDYSRLTLHHTENFLRYHRFLNDCGLKTVFDDGDKYPQFPLEEGVHFNCPDDGIVAYEHNHLMRRMEIRVAGGLLNSKYYARRIGSKILRMIKKRG